MNTVFLSTIAPKKEVVLTVHVLPKKTKQDVLLFDEEKLFMKVALTSAPDQGKANSELISLLSDYFGVAKSYITIRRGMTSRRKLIQIVVP